MSAANLKLDVQVVELPAATVVTVADVTMEEFFTAVRLQLQALEHLKPEFQQFVGQGYVYDGVVPEPVSDMALLYALRACLTVANTDWTLPFMYVPEKQFTDTDMQLLHAETTRSLFPGLSSRGSRVCTFVPSTSQEPRRKRKVC